MPSARAACSAFSRSRDAIAVTSLHSPFCMAGITFLMAILATPSTPHRTLLDTWIPPFETILYSIAISCCASCAEVHLQDCQVASSAETVRKRQRCLLCAPQRDSGPHKLWGSGEGETDSSR